MKPQIHLKNPSEFLIEITILIGSSRFHLAVAFEGRLVQLDPHPHTLTLFTCLIESGYASFF